MSRRQPSRSRTRRLRLSAMELQSFAAKLVPGHVDYLLGGFALTESSAAWLRHDGKYTFRFVYRNREAINPLSVAWTLRGVLAR